MKRLLSFVFMLLLAVTFYGCSLSDNPVDKADNIANAYITIDINPSIEIITGDDGLVVAVNPLNDDAQTLLIDTNYVGLTVEAVVENITNLALEMGYIDLSQDNAIVVTAEAGSETPLLEEKIDETLNKVSREKNIRMNVIKASNNATQAIKDKAQELNISVGKYKLITLAMQFDETLTYETAASMSVRDLNRIVINNRNEMADLIKDEYRHDFFQYRDEIHELICVTKVEMLYDVMLNASDEEFASILTESTTVQAIKDLYKNYRDELLAVKNSTVVTDTENAINADLEESGELSTLKAQKSTLEQEVNQLFAELRNKRQTSEFETIRTQVQAKVNELKGVNAQIRTIVQATIENYNGEDTNLSIRLDEVNGELRVIVQTDKRSQYEEIRVKYEGLFTDLGINLEDLEAIFLPSIQADLDSLRDTINGQIEALKEEARNHKQSIKEEFQEKKDTFKDIWGRGNGKGNKSR